MTSVNCLDIFDAVYVNVKRIYLAEYDAIKIKNKTVAESATENERLTKTELAEPVSVTNVNSLEAEGSTTETVRESVEKVKEESVAADIRQEIEEKFPFIMASFCSNLAKLDKLYRELRGDEAQPEFSSCFIDVSDDFPLSARFVFPSIMYASSLVLIDLNEKKSDDFYAKYVDSVSEIANEIGFLSGSTVEKYPY